jgi:hypothetical protein
MYAAMRLCRHLRTEHEEIRTACISLETGWLDRSRCTGPLSATSSLRGQQRPRIMAASADIDFSNANACTNCSFIICTPHEHRTTLNHAPFLFSNSTSSYVSLVDTTSLMTTA